jgi:type II secretory pathway pseudopilin PulG
MIELIVVIGILVILVGLLMPVISKVRKSAYQADSNAFLSTLSAACQRYYDEFRAYPGPISNTELRKGTSNVVAAATYPSGYATLPATGVGSSAVITGSENLVLGLCGGLKYSTTGKFEYDPSAIGSGPCALVSGGKQYAPYADAVNLTPSFMNGATKTGQFADGVGTAADSVIPEFVDRYPDPLPILYMRARLSVPLPATASDTDNTVVTLSGTGPYDLAEILAYTGSPIGVGKELSKSEYKGSGTPFNHGLRTLERTTYPTLDSTANYPFGGYAYFKDPSSSSTSPTPRAKDMYILISAGTDRVYGTSDDITSFGSLQ